MKRLHPVARGLRRTITTYTATLAVVVIAHTLAGCGPGSVFDSSPSIRGTLRALIPAESGDDLGFARVEGKREEDTQYDKADITITKSTTIFRRRAGQQERLPFDSLQAGQIVEATFTGPVAESYPVRATAATITVIE